MTLPSIPSPCAVRSDGHFSTRIRLCVVDVKFEWLPFMGLNQCKQILRLQCKNTNIKHFNLQTRYCHGNEPTTDMCIRYLNNRFNVIVLSLMQ